MVYSNSRFWNLRAIVVLKNLMPSVHSNRKYKGKHRLKLILNVEFYPLKNFTATLPEFTIYLFD
ncbi:hypothetical protein BpHYR1_014956 [Brachionus plicatilis]|uniref:Uncharacterized protein n=1 Tax=Brachionus plicatilis TaxID=10195 RepID=A0A3M7Q105_BRAPC|nr:hypothetical protein BpHYR1_014956 [Brachionus plicatilis]